MTHMGCTDYGRHNACATGDTLIIFFEREPTGPSVGSGVDHIGFSFPDLAAKMDSFEAAGIKILNPIREIDGLFKLAFIEDRGEEWPRVRAHPSVDQLPRRPPGGGASGLPRAKGARSYDGQSPPG